MVVSETQGIKSHISYSHDNYTLHKSNSPLLENKIKFKIGICCHSWIIYNQLSHIKIKSIK